MSDAIQAFVGSNGGGKSLAAVELAVIPAVVEGRVIVSTINLEVPHFKLLRRVAEIPRLGVHIEDGEPCRLGRRGNRLEVGDRGFSRELPIYSLTDNRPALLFLDEIASSFPARAYASMPVQLQTQLNQLRKPDVTVVWTAPNWARADVILREVTQEVTVCRGFVSDRWVREPKACLWPKPLLDEDGEKIRGNPKWKPHRLFRWVTYDAIEFEEFTANDQHRIAPIARRWYWRPVHQAQFIYNTKAAVQRLDHLDDLGTCMGCGGKRAQPRCSCSFDDDEAEGRPAAEGRAPRPVLLGGSR